MEIKLIISDFDGTLVDTFEANYRAYAYAFESVGLKLARNIYRQCFGMRFDNFMQYVGVDDQDVRNQLREIKGECYPEYFEYLKVNEKLLEFIRKFHLDGGKTAIASTARRKNLINALKHIGAKQDFDIILAGESVSHGKPNPEIYNKVLDIAEMKPSEALVFEDSNIGCQAAKSAGISYIKITL